MNLSVIFSTDCLVAAMRICKWQLFHMHCIVATNWHLCALKKSQFHIFVPTCVLWAPGNKHIPMCDFLII